MNSSILLYNMKDIVQIRKRAIELRRLGYSYMDVANELKISKTSVSNWVKNVRLTENEKNILQKNLKGKIERGRMKASISIRSRKVFKEKVAYENAEKDFKKYLQDSLFMLGLGICWSHASKRPNSFQFTSSDQSIVKIILLWAEKYLDLSNKSPKYRVFIDISCKNQDCEQFWSRVVGLSAELFQKTMYLRSQSVKRSREYKGSLAIVISNIDVVRKIIAWQKLAMRYYS